jgi:AcrR family transcriptional regulator
VGVAAKRLEREREARRIEILDAARKLFLEQGVNKTTMDKIAEAAETSKPTIYSYFHSKNDIVCTLLTHRAKDLTDTLVAGDFPEEPGERLLAMGKCFLEYMSAPHRVADLSFPIQTDFKAADLADDVSAQLKHELSRLVKVLEDLILDGEKAGMFAAGWNPARLMIFAWGTMVGVEELAKRLHPEILPASLEEIFPDMLKIVTRGLMK